MMANNVGAGVVGLMCWVSFITIQYHLEVLQGAAELGLGLMSVTHWQPSNVRLKLRRDDRALEKFTNMITNRPDDIAANNRHYLEFDVNHFQTNAIFGIMKSQLMNITNQTSAIHVHVEDFYNFNETLHAQPIDLAVEDLLMWIHDIFATNNPKILICVVLLLYGICIGVLKRQLISKLTDAVNAGIVAFIVVKWLFDHDYQLTFVFKHAVYTTLFTMNLAASLVFHVIAMVDMVMDKKINCRCNPNPTDQLATNPVDQPRTNPVDQPRTNPDQRENNEVDIRTFLRIVFAVVCIVAIGGVAGIGLHSLLFPRQTLDISTAVSTRNFRFKPTQVHSDGFRRILWVDKNTEIEHRVFWEMRELLISDPMSVQEPHLSPTHDCKQYLARLEQTEIKMQLLNESIAPKAKLYSMEGALMHIGVQSKLQVEKMSDDEKRKALMKGLNKPGLRGDLQALSNAQLIDLALSTGVAGAKGDTAVWNGDRKRELTFIIDGDLQFINFAELALFQGEVKIDASQTSASLFPAAARPHPASNCVDGKLDNFCHSEGANPSLFLHIFTRGNQSFDTLKVWNRIYGPNNEDRTHRIVGGIIRLYEGPNLLWTDNTHFSKKQNEYVIPIPPNLKLFDNNVKRVKGKNGGYVSADCTKGDFIGYSDSASALILSTHESIMGGESIGRVGGVAFRNTDIPATKELASWIIAAAADEYLNMVEVVITMQEYVVFVCAKEVGHQIWNAAVHPTSTLTFDQVNRDWKNKKNDKVQEVATSDTTPGFGIAELAIEWW